MKEEYVVSEERNTTAAFRHFFGPTYPGWRQIARLALRHRLTSGIIVLMNMLGLLAYLIGF